MGEVIQLVKPSKQKRFQHPADAPTLGEFGLSDAELDLLARRAGDIAGRRTFTDTDFEALLRLQGLERVMDSLVALSTEDDDLAEAVTRRRSEILSTLGL